MVRHIYIYIYIYIYMSLGFKRLKGANHDLQLISIYNVIRYEIICVFCAVAS